MSKNDKIYYFTAATASKKSDFFLYKMFT